MYTRRYTMAHKNIYLLMALLALIIVSPNASSAESMLAWDASQGNVTGYRIYYGTSPGNYPFIQEVGNVTQYSLSSLPLQIGTTYYFIVKAYNDVGESEQSNEVSYVINPPSDTTPPLPPQGVAYKITGGDITIYWQANEEPDLSGYRVYSGTSSRSYDPSIPIAGNVTSYTFTGFQEGKYYLAVSAVDISENESGLSAEVVAVIPDLTNPSIMRTSPTNGSPYQSNVSQVDIAGIASDNVGVKQVTWSSTTGGSGIAAGTTSWTANNLSLKEGENVITVTASDNEGNQASSSITVTYTPLDTTMPMVSIKSPTADGTYETGLSSVSLAGIASDNVGVKQVTWSNSNGGSGIANGTNNWSVSGIILTEGENSIVVRARDEVGNEGSQTLLVKYMPENIDNIPPFIKLTSPKDKSSIHSRSSTIDLVGTASDDKGVTEVTWMNSKGGSGKANGTSNWSIPGIELSP
jgi:hypothetical protein